MMTPARKYWAWRNVINGAEPEPETLAFQSMVEGDGGKILDISGLDSYYKYTKGQGLYDSLQFGVRKQFGYRVDGSGNIDKIYDISKNGNHLTSPQATTEEDIENDMFGLFEEWFKDEAVTPFTIGDNFTYLNDINHPNIEANNINYILGMGDVWFYAGGGVSLKHLAYLTTNPSTSRFRSTEGSFSIANDQGVKKSIVFRHSKGVAQNILKDGADVGSQLNEVAAIGFPNPVSKIVYGTRTDENLNNADCYLNKSYFFNEYLTDEQTSIISAL